jgi:hypothetical protein
MFIPSCFYNGNFNNSYLSHVLIDQLDVLLSAALLGVLGQLDGATVLLSRMIDEGLGVSDQGALNRVDEGA